MTTINIETGGGGSTGANPTATAGPTAVNGSSVHFLRADGSPAVQLGSAAQAGLVQVDGTTITASGGVITAVVGGTGTVTSVATDASLTGGPITTSGTLSRAALTGDVTASAGSNATTLANTAVTPATYGDATHVGSFTVDSKGRLTAASNVAISGGGSTGPGTGIYEAKGTTAPLLSSLAWINQTTSSAVDGTNALVITAPSVGATDSLHILKITVPATPFNCYMRFRTFGQMVNFSTTGIVCRNSTSGRLVTLSVVGESSGGHFRQFARWASATSFNADIVTAVTMYGPEMWLRFNVTSTVITSYMSWDGWNWDTIGTETISTYLTATGGTLDEIGVFVNPHGSDMITNIYSFSTTAPV